MYNIRVLDKELKLLAMLTPESWKYNKRKNKATNISVTVTKSELRKQLPVSGQLYRELAREGILHLKIANFIQIYNDSRLLATGVIVSRDVNEKSINIKAMTEEVLLQKIKTPAQYSEVLRGQDITDVARELKTNWETKRLKGQEQWELGYNNGGYISAAGNADTSTEPGVVLLEKDGTGDYFSTGSITMIFDKNSYDEFVEWDRIRWLSDFDEGVVETKVSYAYSNTTSFTNWTTPIAGALTDEVGLKLVATTERYVSVKVDFQTFDTTQTPRLFALGVIARTENDIIIGDIPDTLNLAVDVLDADYNNCLDLLTEACEQTGTEFRIENKTLSLDRDLGSNRTNNVLLRNGSNINITNLSDEDRDITNVITAIGEGDGINRTEITIRNEESIAEYGEYSEVVEFDTTKINELELLANSYLEEKAFPETTFSVKAIFGDDEPVYGFNDIVKVVDPETGSVFDIRIDEETRSYGSNGLSVELELARTRRRLLEGVLEPKRINSAKQAQYLLTFETTWVDQTDYNSPFFDQTIPVTIGTGVYPSFDDEDKLKYCVLLDSVGNEIAREKYATKEIAENYITSTYFFELQDDQPEQVVEIGWVAGQSATDTSGTGILYDTKPFTTTYRFIPVGKTERRG